MWLKCASGLVDTDWKLARKMSMYPHQKAITIKTFVPNSRPEASCSSSKEVQNDPGRPKLLPMGPEASVESIYLQTGHLACNNRENALSGLVRKSVNKIRFRSLLEPARIGSKSIGVPHVSLLGARSDRDWCIKDTLVLKPI